MFKFFTKSLSTNIANVKKICADPEVQAAARNVADATATIAGLTAFAAAKQWIVTEGRDAIERAYADDDSGKAAAVKMLGDVAELVTNVETIVSTTNGIDKMTARCEQRTKKAIVEKLEAGRTAAFAAHSDLQRSIEPDEPYCSEAKKQAIERELEAALAETE